MDDLYEYISKRKSIRKYQQDKLQEDDLARIVNVFESLPRLNSSSFSCSLHAAVVGLFTVKAPHYLVVGGEKNEQTSLNVGFVLQLWTMWMAKMGYGTVWQGVSRPTDYNGWVMSVAFGKPNEPLFRRIEDFRRKELAQICDGDSVVLGDARLAQSGTNTQPWFFKVVDGGIYVYTRSNINIKQLFYDFPSIDIGIVLANIYLSCGANGLNFKFSPEQVMPLKGYRCFGRIDIE